MKYKSGYGDDRTGGDGGESGHEHRAQGYRVAVYNYETDRIKDSRVPILDISEDKVQLAADEIVGDGGEAIACNARSMSLIRKASGMPMRRCLKHMAHAVSGSTGGNSPRAATGDEFFARESLDSPIQQYRIWIEI